MNNNKYIWKCSGLLLVLMFILCGVSFGYAKSTEPMRYWLENGSHAKRSHTIVSGDNPLSLNFSSDPSTCKKNYGSNWDQVCSRNVGDILPSTKDIRLDPPHAGKWKWTSATTLRFYPTKAWLAGKKYIVHIGKKSLPKYTTLTQNPQFYSANLKVSVYGSFKFDPDQYQNMQLTGKFNFNYPVNAKSLHERLSIDVFGNTSLLLGTPEENMDVNNQVLYYSIPILELPKETMQVDISMAQGYSPKYGGVFGVGATHSIKIPAKSSMLQIESLHSQVIDMPDLSVKQTLNYTFSMPVLPKNLEKSLDVYLMPRQRIDSDSLKKKAPYKWWNLKEVNNKFLKNAQPMNMTLLNDADTPTRFISFAVDKPIENGRYFYTHINKGLQGPAGYTLAKNGETFVRVSTLNSDVKILQTGSVLNLKGDKKISLYARNLDEIKYKIYQIQPEYLNIYVSSFGMEQRSRSNLNGLSIVSNSTTSLVLENSEKAQFSSLDLSPFLKNQQKGIFFLTVDGNLKNDRVTGDSRFIMLTDIGIIRKKNSDGSSHIYTVSLESGLPLSGVDVEILGENGIAIYEGITNVDGMVRAPSLKTYKNEKYPVAVIAKKSGDLAYIPYASYSNILDRSYTGGKKGVGDGMYGFIFNQRDLYKPGETAHFGFILKQADFDSATLTGIPLEVSIYNSRDKIVERKKIKLNANGLGEMRYAIPVNAITGNYRIGISLVDDNTRLLSENFQVEEFEPETLRLDVEFNIPPKKGWYLPKDLKNIQVHATLMNLFGSPAVDHLISGIVETQPASFGFSEYADWNFYDAARLERSKDYSLVGVESDAKGFASFSIPTPLFEKETSVLFVSMRGFNAAGSRSVMKRARLITSPLEAVLGWKSATSLDYIPQNTTAHLEIMAIDSFLSPYNFGSFTMEYYAVDYVRSLVKNQQGEYVYRKERKETLVDTKKLNLTKKSLKWDIDTQKSGEKLLIAKDADKRTILRIPYTVAGESLPQFGEMNTADLSAKLNKSHYDFGEDIEIYMHLPYDGAGLITIERENVISQEWFTAKRGERIQKIAVPNSIEGRAYLNILYFRDLQDVDIFTEPSASLVLPFTANLNKRKLDLSLEVLPDSVVENSNDMPVIRPGSNFQVKIHSNNPSKAIIFAVDEGILQMTGYKTPNPITELLVNRALEVTTYQYFDLLMPEFSVLGMYLSKFGGDLMMSEMMMKASANSNPFKRKGIKSVAFWSGIVDVDKKGTIVDIPVPATFNGQLRVMAVGISESKMNATQKTVLARSEVVMQPSVPYFVAPGDEFVANLTLIDMSKTDAREWTLSVKTSKALKLIDKSTLEVRLEPQKQKTISLRFKVEIPHKMSQQTLAELLGNQEIHFNLSNGKSTISMPISLSVRPAVGLQNIIHFGQLAKNGSRYGHTLDLQTNWYPQRAELSASMSSIPQAIVQGLVEELREKAYDCTPSRLSESFPLLAIMQNQQFALSGEAYSKNNIGEEIGRTIQILARRYSNNSYFSMWSNDYGRSNIFENAYIADFLVEAQNMGISIPYGLKRNFLESLEDQISRMPRNMSEARSFAYGAWVLTQNGVITSNVMSNLVSWLEKNGGAWEKDIIAPLIAASMDLMMEEDVANRLLSGYTPDINKAWAWSATFDGLGERALYLSIIAKQFPDKVNLKKTTDTVNQMIALISNKQYRDVSAALAARSLIFYSVAKEKNTQQITWAMKLLDDDNSVILSNVNENNDTLEASLQSKNSLVSKAKRITMDSNTPLYYHLNASGYPLNLPFKSTSDGLEISREYRDLDGNVLSELTVGEEIIVAIRARVRSEVFHDIVITDLFPAAFELILAEDGVVNTASVDEGQASANQTEDDMHTLYVDRREDRMIIYASVDNNETVFRYRVRVAHKGDFVIPPIQGKGLVDPTIQAITIMDFGKSKDVMSVQ